MEAHVFSPTNLAFYATILRDTYDANGSWPADAVEVSSFVWSQYIGVPPDGKMLGADPQSGQPIWVDLPAPPPPTQAQAAAIMLATGIQIASATNPTLDGTYPCDATSGSQEGSLLAAISAGLTLPNNVAIRVDTSGQPHAFSVDEFKNFCQAKMIFQQQLTTIIGTGSGALPEQPTAIP